MIANLEHGPVDGQLTPDLNPYPKQPRNAAMKQHQQTWNVTLYFHNNHIEEENRDNDPEHKQHCTEERKDLGGLRTSYR